MNTDLQNSYRFHRLKGCSALGALSAARNDITNGKKRYPSEAGGMRGGPTSKDGLFWCECPKDYMRFVGYSDEILPRLGHTGWFTDDDGDGELLRGVVYQLPSRKGKTLFMYGYADPCNDGATRLSIKPTDDKEDAARWADHDAEHAAEEERDYRRAWQAGARYRDLGDEVIQERRDCLELIAEAKAACDALASYASLKASIRAAVIRHVDTIRDLRREREELFDNYGREPAFNHHSQVNDF